MAKKLDLYKLRLGKTQEEVFPHTTADSAINQRILQLQSDYPLRLLGNNSNGGVYMSEEEREVNFHIIGGSRQGKSKYLEHHIREDIKAGNGICLIDPSDFGATYNAVLHYCASIGHKKVCIINPSTLYNYGKIACIQPLNKDYPAKSVSGVMETVNILFNSNDINTPRIKLNLSALFRMLAAEGLTLNEASYFAEYEKPHWKTILDNATESKDTLTLQEKFRTLAYWKSEFTTTLGRLAEFRDEPLSLMLASTTGIDFVKMIEEGWVILVNLFPEPYLTYTTSRLLGILIISQIIQAVDALNDRKGGWQNKFYLYIDEAGRFATPQIENLLSNKSKSGLRLIFAHHHFDQFEDKKILTAIKHNTGIKVMFAIRDADDRLQMMKLLGFGGQVSPADASFRFRNLGKRHMLVKKNKEDTVEAVTPNVESINVPLAQLDEYVRSLLDHPWYLPKYAIEQQIKSRIKESVTTPNDPAPAHSPPPKQRTVSNSKADGDPAPARRKTLLDLGPEAEKFIRNNTASEPNG